MSVIETRSFMQTICEHPDCSTIKQVDIITSNAVIITDFFNDMIKIIQFDDDPKDGFVCASDLDN